MIKTTKTSLAELTMDTTVRPITDELAALKRLRPLAPTTDEAYAIFTSQLPSVMTVAARGRRHAIEVDRFFKLATRTADQALIREQLTSVWALTMLNHAATIAVALLPSRGAQDDWVRAQTGNAVVEAAKTNNNDAQAALARAAFGLDQPVGKAALPLAMINGAKRLFDAVGALTSSTEEVAGIAGICSVEQAASLAAFIRQRPDLPGWLADAEQYLSEADRLSDQFAHDRLTLQRQDLLSRAQAGAMILGVASLARIGLWPARCPADRELKASALRLSDQRVGSARFKAIAGLAFEIGEQAEEQFKLLIPVRGGVEL